MSPRAQITAPPKPHVARQTDPSDPYGLASLSSVYAELSSLYPDLYSSYSYDESLYSSAYNSYLSLLMSSYTYDGLSATGTGATATAGRSRTSNPTPTADTISGNGGQQDKGGLSTGAKIGIGVGVPLAVAILAGIGIFLWCAGKRKGKKNGTTIVQPPVQQQQPQFQPPQQQVYPPNNHGYIQGYQGQASPPQYAQTQPEGNNTAYTGYAKGPEPGVMEMEQEYHFARPGVVEMDSAPAQEGRK